ncbi:hypothetical protein C6P46_002777 [Rhodotorula mucilaginosa]|uniref:Uncharacterized protein n=1 Tax=Rhodotorula mucilaginosa TaxID=5537 RepID=A0A9P6VSD4_RHOMI|nr:hypothetical protein C6P46_002777 [Rhodotorula mucilaginosa]TKA52174.1 hypothetical protein B0A53_05018 [Rhodotorula sp. CCFEE 5036]
MYLRWQRTFFFALTQALCIVSVSLASWALAYGIDKQHKAKRILPSSNLDLSDAFAVGGSVTAAAGVASILCLCMTIWTIIFPRKSETLRSVRIKEAMFAFAIGFFIATLIPATYITATKSGQLTAPGLSPAVIQTLLKATGEKLAYKDQTPIIAYVVVGWIALVSLIISLVFVSIAARKTLKYGEDGTGPLSPPEHQEHHVSTHHHHHNGSVHDVSESESGRPSMATEKPLGTTAANEKTLGTAHHV